MNELYADKPQNISIIQVLFFFSGRINRSQFWLVYIGFVITLFVLLTINSNAGIIFSLFSFYSLIATQAKRWHDLGKSSWNCMWSFAPVVGIFLVILEAGIHKGQKFDNQYGTSLYKC